LIQRSKQVVTEPGDKFPRGAAQPIKEPMNRKALFMEQHHPMNARITTACILAAGTGSRLLPLTDCSPKCLTEVHGRSILERLVTCLRAQGFKRLVFVVGYLESCIRDYLELHAADLTIEFVFNPDFATTNNSYSLWLARDKIKEPFLLLESDLVFDAPLLRELSYPDRIAVSRTLPWMNGTTVMVNAENRVSEFRMNGDLDSSEESFKTVNICSLSAKSWRVVVERLSQYVSAGRLTEYYESVFRDLVAEGRMDFECVFFDESRWYEIDTIEDLRCAQEMFGQAGAGEIRALPQASTVA
jgi:choline kinase